MKKVKKTTQKPKKLDPLQDLVDAVAASLPGSPGGQAVAVEAPAPTKRKKSRGPVNPSIAPEKNPASFTKEQLAAMKQIAKSAAEHATKTAETGLGTGIMLDEHRNTYLPIGEGRWLAQVAESNRIEVVSTKIGKGWTAYDGKNSIADAVRIFEKSFLPKTPEAAREICRLLGRAVPAPVATTKITAERKEPAEAAGYTLAALCAELKIDPFEARKTLRSAKAKKPGSRWEWKDKDAAKDIIAILKKEVKPS